MWHCKTPTDCVTAPPPRLIVWTDGRMFFEPGPCQMSDSVQLSLNAKILWLRGSPVHYTSRPRPHIKDVALFPVECAFDGQVKISNLNGIEVKVRWRGWRRDDLPALVKMLFIPIRFGRPSGMRSVRMWQIRLFRRFRESIASTQTQFPSWRGPVAPFRLVTLTVVSSCDIAIVRYSTWNEIKIWSLHLLHIRFSWRTQVLMWPYRLIGASQSCSH